MKVKENIDLIISHHPHSESLNKKLLEDSTIADYESDGLSYRKYVYSQHSPWRTTSSTITLIKNWVTTLIKQEYGIKGANINALETWFSRYKKGDYALPHWHKAYLFAFVYFVKCPSGSSPLILTTSGKRIKAEEGKVVIFPGVTEHHVPKNQCDDRIVLAGNVLNLGDIE